MNVRFELTGIMPLLMHQDDVEASDMLSEWRKDPGNKNVSVAGDDRSPAWTWQTYLYSDGQHVTIPSANLMVALRQAGAQIIMKKQKTYKEISQSGLLIPTEFLEFKANGKHIPMAAISAMHDSTFKQQAEAVKDLGFLLSVKRARVGNSKHVRVRPRFNAWSVIGTIGIMAKEITYEVLEQLFDIAGRVGLLDWRPGCKTPGPYGMFTAKLKKA